MIQTCLLAGAVCMDTLFAAMGCSMSGIAIPKRCALLVSAVGTLFLSISLFCSEVLAGILPEGVCRYGGCVILGGMGLMQLCKGVFRSLLQNRESMRLRCKGIGLVIQICLDETYADADGSKELSMGEACAFSAAMSLDSLASGLGAGIGRGYILPCLFLTLVLGFAVTVLGSWIGKRSRKERDYSWIGGILLLLLAIGRIAV